MSDDDPLLSVMGAAVMSLATDAIFVFDAATLQVVEANRAFTRAFGYTREEAKTLSVYQIAGAERAEVDQNLAALAASGEIMLGVRRYRRKDGAIVEMESRTGATVVEGRKLYCVVSRDLTGIREAERSLRESEERFRKLADAALEGIVITEGGRIVDGNARLAELLRAPLGDIIGKPVADFVAPRSMETVAERFRTGSEFPYEHMAMRSDGTVFPVEVQARNAIIGGRTLRVSAIRDISQRRNLEEQVRLAQRMESVGRLAGGVAHDFNNLLTVILSLVDILLDAPRDPTDADDLQQVRAAAQRAADLTKQLLAFARRQVVEPRVIDLNALVRDLDVILHRLIGEDVELKTAYTAGPVSIRADPGQVEQVLMNIAINARDAMPSGGTLTIAIHAVELDEDHPFRHADMRPGAYVMISLGDTGVGMDRATLAHIFEPFFTTKSPGKGTGLGLATCYGIAKQCGGSILVESEPGKGTTFQVYFPRVWDAVPARGLPPPDAAPTGNERLMVVEDDALVRRLAVRILESKGYQVLEAADGAEALRLFEEQGGRQSGRIDLIVTDVVLPRLSGKELAERVQSARPGIKVLYTSGYAENTIVHQGIVEPGVSFLAKPYLPSELAQRVRAILDAK